MSYLENEDHKTGGNFNPNAPKALELFKWLMGQPAGTIVRRNDYPGSHHFADGVSRLAKQWGWLEPQGRAWVRTDVDQEQVVLEPAIELVRVEEDYVERISKVYVRSPQVRAQAKLRDDYTCQICGKRDERKGMVDVDHIEARSDGGVDTLANVQTLCPSCHREKTYGHEHLKNFGEPGMPG